MFDFLHAVDWIVDDPVLTANRFSAVFGLPEVRPDFEQILPTHGYGAVFLRTADRLGDAPTRLEFIAPRPVRAQPGCSVAPLEQAARLQARRPQRTHATVLCVADFDGFAESVRRRGAALWIEPGCEHLPHPRGWVGWLDAGCYVPGFDGGLWLEFIATSALGARMVDAVTNPESTEAVRVSRRVHLVGDLDATLHALETSTGLVPSVATAWDDHLRGRTARFEFRHPGSSDLELVQPRGAGPAGDSFACWGEGPLLTTMAVPDVAATIATAQAAGATPIDSLRADGSVVFRDDALGGILVEITATGEGVR